MSETPLVLEFQMPDPSVPPLEIAVRPVVANDAASMLGSILKAVDYGVMLTDLNHVALAGNARFGELFGIDIERMVESDVAAVRAMVENRIGDFEQWYANLERVYADPEYVQSDTLTLKNPDLKLLRYTGPVRDQNGAPVGRIWTFLDITQRERSGQMDEILHRTSLLFDPEPKRVYEQIVESIGDFYQSLSLLSIRKGDFMEFHAFGGPVPEARALPGNDLAQSYCQFCLEAGKGTIVQDASLQPEMRDLMPARLGFTRYAGVPIIAPSGDVFGTLCILDTRTHEPHGDEDLRFLSFMAMRISSELEREAQLKELERDLASTQHQLIQSEKLAATGTLAASIAHDIRNIVSAISLDMGMEPSGSVDAIKTVQTHLDRFSVLAHRLLSYAQPREIMRQPTCLAETLARVSGLLRHHFEVSNIKFELRLPPEMPQILADSTRLEHMFLNLCMNAIQAMKHGGKLIISARQTGAQLHIEVKDNGPGMDELAIKRAFEPFTSSRADGFGLGLFSCRQIVKDCGGTIAIESTVGEGTTFKIEVPAL